MCDGGKQQLLAQLRTWLNANSKLHLYKNNHAPVHGDTVSAYTESDFVGYAAVALTAWGAPYLTADFHAYIDEVVETFTAGLVVGSQSVYGYYVTDLAGVLIWAELAPSPVTINAAGQTFAVLPRFSDTSEF